MDVVQKGHISHIYSDRMSSRPMGWSTTNVNNMSKLRTAKEDNISTKEILENSKKVIEFKEIQIVEKVCTFLCLHNSLL